MKLREALATIEPGSKICIAAATSAGWNYFGVPEDVEGIVNVFEAKVKYAKETMADMERLIFESLAMPFNPSKKPNRCTLPPHISKAQNISAYYSRYYNAYKVVRTSINPMDREVTSVIEFNNKEGHYIGIEVEGKEGKGFWYESEFLEGETVKSPRLKKNKKGGN